MTGTFFSRRASCACLLLASVAGPVWADPAASFKHFQGWSDEPVKDWRAANARVGEVGGWRTYLRESQRDGGAGPGRDAAGAQPQTPADAGHGGHPHHHHGH